MEGAGAGGSVIPAPAPTLYGDRGCKFLTAVAGGQNCPGEAYKLSAEQFRGQPLSQLQLSILCCGIVVLVFLLCHLSPATIFGL